MTARAGLLLALGCHLRCRAELADQRRHRHLHWRDLDLNIAILGFPKCGTNSLEAAVRNVAVPVIRNSSGSLKVAHNRQSIGFEDGFFALLEGPQERPWQAHGIHFNDRSLDDSGQTRGALRFIRSPVCIYNIWCLQALAKIPKLRVILTVRDPSEQYVSWYNNFFTSSVYRFAGAERQLPSLEQAVRISRRLGPDGRLDALPAGDRRLVGRVPRYMTYHRFLRHGGRFVGLIERARGLFAERLMVMHMDELRAPHSQHAMRALWRFLGVSEGWPARAPAENRGRGMDALCSGRGRSRRLRSNLTEMLAQEYEGLYGPGGVLQHLRMGPCRRGRLRRCTAGVAAGRACCARACGACGGAGCDARPGGSAACCGGSIRAPCNSSAGPPPCMYRA